MAVCNSTSDSKKEHLFCSTEDVLFVMIVLRIRSLEEESVCLFCVTQSCFFVLYCLCALQDLKDFMRSAGEITFADAHKQRVGEG